eukprot:c15056_g2_i4.p1 GENE.c15056_g2_i4~~c15056_g2_i4.p1  ORF type:complete len:266 (+),score=51.16 c15056_g2_i4:243-1040(+)
MTPNSAAAIGPSVPRHFNEIERATVAPPPLDPTTQVNMARYCSALRQDNQPGGDLEVAALAAVFKRSVMVYRVRPAVARAALGADPVRSLCEIFPTLNHMLVEEVLTGLNNDVVKASEHLSTVLDPYAPPHWDGADHAVFQHMVTHNAGGAGGDTVRVLRTRDETHAQGWADCFGHYSILVLTDRGHLAERPVPRDGNCLFVSMLRMCDEYIASIPLTPNGHPLLRSDVQKVHVAQMALRDRVAQHILRNMSMYQEYLPRLTFPS